MGAVVVEVTCRSLACVLELVVAEVACRSRACAWALVVATDPGCWADEGELALEPSRPLVCRVTAASVSVRELIPEQLLGEEADPSACPPRWDVAAPLVSGAVCLPINGCRPSLIVCQSARMNSQPTIGELSGAALFSSALGYSILGLSQRSELCDRTQVLCQYFV